MPELTLPGINIQYPISKEILSGNKVIETRTYPLPKKYFNQRMFFIETPGDQGNFKARIVGIITFSDFKQYSSQKEFYNDSKKHLINKDSTWAWKEGPKYGWIIEKIEVINPPIVYLEPKGIKFTKAVTINY